jgi:Na+/H+ antiporter NhaD/arsenite permease-like protein
MASTLAGNFTLVGSVANLIVAQRARAEGVVIGFWSARTRSVALACTQFKRGFAGGSS